MTTPNFRHRPLFTATREHSSLASAAPDKPKILMAGRMSVSRPVSRTSPPPPVPSPCTYAPALSARPSLESFLKALVRSPSNDRAACRATPQSLSPQHALWSSEQCSPEAETHSSRITFGAAHKHRLGPARIAGVFRELGHVENRGQRVGMVSAACLLLDRERLLVMLQAPLVLVLALQHLSTRAFVPEDRLSNADQTPYKTTGEILIAFPSSFGATAPDPREDSCGLRWRCCCACRPHPSDSSPGR